MENSTHIPPDEPASASPELAQSIRRGHEQRDVKLRAVIIFAVALAVSAAIIQLGVWGLMEMFHRENAASDPIASPFADEPSSPPEPRLQPSVAHDSQPDEDMAALRKRWLEELTSYASVEGDPQRAQIPIDRAMQILVDRGLPAATSRPSTNAIPAGGEQ
jgi:hypothetical protein